MSTPNSANHSRAVALRSSDTVMRLARMGAFHQTRLSFMRVLLRRLAADKWHFERPQWSIDNAGVGTALYTAIGPERTYTLVAFAHDLDPKLRSDRVIAEAWDATFTLFDGKPSALDIERLRAVVPLQEAGHISARELTLSRANRSVRLFESVVSTLASGRQPRAQDLDEVGYLMRTTAVYGSGKFGACDRRFIREREEFSAPFQVELLTVFLIRAFSVDIVEHLARVSNPCAAVSLAPELRRRVGVGNSTGLGMAPFVVNHPTLVDRWVTVRETALARVRSVVQVESARRTRLVSFISRMHIDAQQWLTKHPEQAERVKAYRVDLDALLRQCTDWPLNEHPQPWNQLYCWAEKHLSMECQEALVSALIELYPELVDELSARMHMDESASFDIDGSMPIARLRALIERNYGFALDCDFDTPSNNARFWYASEEKLEPRLGQRFEEPGADREHPLAIGRDVAALFQFLQHDTEHKIVAELLLSATQHRHTVRRVQASANYTYAEIRDNLIADLMLPIDILRFKLAFFGATKFDPRSDRWTRITMFQNAPYPQELADGYVDDWVYPQALAPRP
jgi:hypothetical protein